VSIRITDEMRRLAGRRFDLRAEWRPGLPFKCDPAAQKAWNDALEERLSRPPNPDDVIAAAEADPSCPTYAHFHFDDDVKMAHRARLAVARDVLNGVELVRVYVTDEVPEEDDRPIAIREEVASVRLPARVKETKRPEREGVEVPETYAAQGGYASLDEILADPARRWVYVQTIVRKLQRLTERTRVIQELAEFHAAIDRLADEYLRPGPEKEERQDEKEKKPKKRARKK
jgi:hypothetical protein